MEKHDEIQLPKRKIDLNNRKMNDHPSGNSNWSCAWEQQHGAHGNSNMGRMGTARMKWDKETEEGKKRGVGMESKDGTKKYVTSANHD